MAAGIARESGSSAHASGCSDITYEQRRLTVPKRNLQGLDSRITCLGHIDSLLMIKIMKAHVG